ncbi:MAG: 30S ribosomal protein S8 [Actinomycetota bacterium]|nr:30S ribosomal protein S8 [Actinomycetota bacterium]
MLTRIRNANLSFKEELHVPASKMNEALARILEQEGYIASFERDGEGVEQSIRLRLKFGRARERTITGLRRVSKPGNRVYAKRDALPRVMGGLGVAILSTSQGLMTDRQAARAHLGGEVLAYVW